MSFDIVLSREKKESEEEMFARTLIRNAIAPSMLRSNRSLMRGARALHVEASKESVSDLIEKVPVLVFSKTHCPYSTRVKELFEEINAGHKVVELDERPDGAEIQAILLELTGQRTVPNVFIKGKHIGGCDATLALHDEQKLLPLLK